MKSVQRILFSRLVLISFMFSLLVGIGVYIYVGYLTRDFVLRDNSNALSLMLKHVQGNYLEQLKGLDDLSRLKGFHPYSSEVAREQAQGFLKYKNVFSSIHYYHLNGDLEFAVRRGDMPEYRIAKNFYARGDQRFIQFAVQAIKSRKSVTSETFYTDTGELFQTYIVPVFRSHEDHQVVGILSGGVFPYRQNLDHLVTDLTFADGNVIVINDSKGNTLAESGFSDNKEFKTLFTQKLKGATANVGKSDAVELKSESEDFPYFFIHEALPKLNLVATLGVHTGVLKKKKAEIFRLTVLALIFTFILSVVTARYVVNDFSARFKHITDGIREVSSGNFQHKIEYGSRDEIGNLGEKINGLVEKIDREKTLADFWLLDDDRADSKNPDQADS